MTHQWQGVFPAVTTKFLPDDSIDRQLMQKHFQFQLSAGVHGFIVCGSLGESSTLSFNEKLEVLQIAVSTVANRVPVLACVAETTTAEACRFAREAATIGASGFMVLPAMLYPADHREVISHFRQVAQATDLPIMVYNNPVSYKVDITPQMFAELADEPKFVAIKESSDDIRRITDLYNTLGNRYAIFSGVDNLALESIMLGAVGWVAGLVCAFPAETVAIYNLAEAGRYNEARDIYRWFMPLLHLDVSTKLVQNIKLVEQLVGVGSEQVRAPRLTLVGHERAHVQEVVAQALANRPRLEALQLLEV